uniref:(northern house mosquito) hypothetical protein n=1 Tax=Culex pipiens TaxID=7175 RepID=A0A8D8FFT9_CULPI
MHTSRNSAQLSVCSRHCWQICRGRMSSSQIRTSKKRKIFATSDSSPAPAGFTSALYTLIRPVLSRPRQSRQKSMSRKAVVPPCWPTTSIRNGPEPAGPPPPAPSAVPISLKYTLKLDVNRQKRKQKSAQNHKLAPFSHKTRRTPVEPHPRTYSVLHHVRPHKAFNFGQFKKKDCGILGKLRGLPEKKFFFVWNRL